MTHTITASGEILKERIKTLVSQFDEALGCPPFDHPSELALSRAEDLAKELESKNPIDLGLLAEVPVICYSFPVLCAAVPQGSTTAVHVPLFRSLLRSLSTIAPLAKYPLKDIVKKSVEILSLDDIVLFNFLLAAKALEKEHLEKILRMVKMPREEKGNQKKKKKSGKNATKVILSPTLAPSKTYLEIPEKLLLRLFSVSLEEPLRSVVVAFVTFPFVFDDITKNRPQLAELIFAQYSRDVIPILSPTSLVAPLSGNLWWAFVEVIDKTRGGEAIASLTSVKVVDDAIRSWGADIASRWNDVVTAATAESPSSHLFIWGKVVGSMFLLHCCLALPRQMEMMGAIEQSERKILLFVWQTLVTAGQDLFPCGREKERSTITEFMWLHSMEITFLALHESKTFFLDDIMKEERMKKNSTVLRGILMTIWKEKSKSWTCRSSSPFLSSCATNKKNAGRKKGKKFSANRAFEQANKKHEEINEVAGQLFPLQGDSTQAMDPSEPFTEKNIQKLLIVFLYVDDVLGVSLEDKWRTITIFKDSLSKLKKGNQNDSTSLTSNTWKLFLDHVEALGRVIPSSPDSQVSLPLSELSSSLCAALKSSGWVYWIAPFVASENKEVHTWWKQWSVPLMVELVLAFSKVNRRSAVPSCSKVKEDPLVLAGLWITLLTEPQKDALVLALGNINGCLDALLPFLCKSFHSGTVSDEDREEKAQLDLVSKKSLLFSTYQRVEEKEESTCMCCSRSYEEGVKGFLNRIQQHIEEDTKLREEKQRMMTIITAERMQQKVLEDTQRQKEHLEYQNLISQKEEQKREQKERIKDIVRTEEAEKQRRKERIFQQLQRQRDLAVAVALERERQSAAEREVLRQKKIEEYKEASLRSFRASTFLHSLGFSTSRVITILNEVVSRKKDIRPDDLLEYVVTGNVSIPEDMLMESIDEAEQVGQKDKNSLEKQGAIADSKEEVSPISFWEDVLQGSSVLEGKKNPEKALQTPESHSFHFRTRLYLDLFCYDGGDEYGQLPETLPQVSVKLAEKLLSPEEVAATGFCSANEAFCQLSRKTLIRLKNKSSGQRNTIAQLTPLGFRFHFPFHDPKGMLAVRIHAQKEKVLTLLKARQLSAQQETSRLHQEDAQHDFSIAEEEEVWTDFDSLSEEESDEEKKSNSSTVFE